MVQCSIKDQLKEKMKLLDEMLQQGNATSSSKVLQLSRQIDYLIVAYFKENKI